MSLSGVWGVMKYELLLCLVWPGLALVATCSALLHQLRMRSNVGPLMTSVPTVHCKYCTKCTLYTTWYYAHKDQTEMILRLTHTSYHPNDSFFFLVLSNQLANHSWFLFSQTGCLKFARTLNDRLSCLPRPHALNFDFQKVYKRKSLWIIANV